MIKKYLVVNLPRDRDLNIYPVKWGDNCVSI
jgi:hypothetical protein